MRKEGSSSGRVFDEMTEEGELVLGRIIKARNMGNPLSEEEQATLDAYTRSLEDSLNRSEMMPVTDPVTARRPPGTFSSPFRGSELNI